MNGVVSWEDASCDAYLDGFSFLIPDSVFFHTQAMGRVGAVTDLRTVSVACRADGNHCWPGDYVVMKTFIGRRLVCSLS